MEKEFGTIGTHIACDLWGVDFALLDDEITAVAVLVACAEKAGATVLDTSVKKFEPNGYTIILTLAESHLSIHSYPEKGFAGADCYTCGDTVDPLIAINGIIDYLNPKRISLITLSRGHELGIQEIGSLTRNYD